MSHDRATVFLAEALPHLGELHRFASRLAREPSAAEDLVQEAFLRAWRGFDRFEPGTNCRAWLYRILILVAWGERRKGARDSRTLALEDAPEVALATVHPTPEVFGRDHLLAAFESLPEGHRHVLQLADVEGLRYREVAEALDLPIGTVMSRLSRARALLRRRLAERLEPGGAPLGERDAVSGGTRP